MADTDLVAKLSAEGRIVIPAEVRRRLGLSSGDFVWFDLHPDGIRVELVPARSLIEQVWANNQGGDAVDSTDLVREMRIADQLVDAISEAEQDSAPADEADEEVRTAELLAALGLTT
jgi:AbrB family looped-hinge helix DNA binding protein